MKDGKPQVFIDTNTLLLSGIVVHQHIFKSDIYASRCSLPALSDSLWLTQFIVSTICLILFPNQF